MGVLLRLYSYLRITRALSLLRALLVTLLLGLWLLSALPSRPLDDQALERPRNAAWLGAVRAGSLWLTVDRDVEAVDRRVLATSSALVELRNRLYAPFESTFRTLEMGQRWGLFLQGQRDVFRIQVEGREAERGFELLYRARKYDALGLDELLSYRRLRGIYNPHAKRGVRADYEGFVTWLAQRVFAARPRINEVRVSMQRYRLPSRGQPMRLLGTEFESTRARGGAT